MDRWMESDKVCRMKDVDGVKSVDLAETFWDILLILGSFTALNASWSRVCA